MLTNTTSRGTDALYVSWKIPDAAPSGAGRARRRLSKGEAHHLYRLRSWVIVGDEAYALLTPAAGLEQIAEAIWGAGSSPTSSRWVASRECAGIARQIETEPVVRGLTLRPEQWRYSSAFAT